MKTTFIYELIDPITDETRYIGKSIDPKHRLNFGHLKDKYNSYKNNWIKALLKQNLKPILNVIDEVNESEWQFWEIFYISLYRSWNCRLTNLTGGGEGFESGEKNPAKRPEVRRLLSFQKLGEKNPTKRIEVRLKISQTKKNKKIKITPEHKRKLLEGYKKYTPTEEARKKMSLANKGKRRSSEVRKKISIASIGKHGNKRTEETKRRMSKSKTGHVVSRETREKIKKTLTGRRNTKSEKPILQFTLTKELVKRWDSVSQAVKFFKTKTISNCLLGRRQSAKGFIWNYDITN